MGTQRLTAAGAVSVCAALLGLSIGTAVDAQGASPAQSPLCQILTPKEIKSALKMQVDAGIGGDTPDGRIRQCIWNAGDGSGRNVIADFEPGTFDSSFYKSYLDRPPQTIAGHQAIISSTGIIGAVEVGDHLLTITWGTLNPAKGTSLKKLVQAATPRLASLPLAAAPTAAPMQQPSSAPQPSLDTGLAALFPTDIEGITVVPELSVLSEFLGSGDPNDPASADPIDQLGTLLATQGRSLADVEVEATVVVVGTDGLLLEAMRVAGVDMTAIADQVAPLAGTYLSDPVATHGQVLGRNVMWLTDGPDTPETKRLYLYPANDVLWEVAGPEQLVTDAFQQLPCAADALTVPTADNDYSCGATPASGGTASPGAAPGASAAPVASPLSASPGSGVSLESLFPDTLGGAPADVVVSTGKAAFSSYDPSFVASMDDVLAQHGKHIDDLSVAIASFTAKGGPWSITAYRVPGLDASVTATLNDPLLAAFYPKAKRAAMTIAGKDVTLLSNGKYSPKGRFVYIYLKDDVAWYIDAIDPDLTQILAALP